MDCCILRLVIPCERSLHLSSFVFVFVFENVTLFFFFNSTPIHERDAKVYNFAGNCPFHGSCLEGMCAAGAIAGRLHITPAELSDLKDDDPVWDVIAFYLAHLCVTLVLVASPEVCVKIWRRHCACVVD